MLSLLLGKCEEGREFVFYPLDFLEYQNACVQVTYFEWHFLLSSHSAMCTASMWSALVKRLFGELLEHTPFYTGSHVAQASLELVSDLLCS